MSNNQSTAEVANSSGNKSAKPDNLANARETKTLCGWTQRGWPYEGSFYEFVSELDEMIFASQIRVSKMKSIQACKVNNIVAVAKALMYDGAKRIGIPTTHKPPRKRDASSQGVTLQIKMSTLTD